MPSCLVTSDTKVSSLHRCMTFPGCLAISPPEHNEWWMADINMGTNWMLTVKRTKDSVEYILWDSTNNGYLEHSQVYLTSSSVPKNLPFRYFMWWSACVMIEYFKLWWVKMHLAWLYISIKIDRYKRQLTKSILPSRFQS